MSVIDKMGSRARARFEELVGALEEARAKLNSLASRRQKVAARIEHLQQSLRHARPERHAEIVAQIENENAVLDKILAEGSRADGAVTIARGKLNAIQAYLENWTDAQSFPPDAEIPPINVCSDESQAQAIERTRSERDGIASKIRGLEIESSNVRNASLPRDELVAGVARIVASYAAHAPAIDTAGGRAASLRFDATVNGGAAALAVLCKFAPGLMQQQLENELPPAEHCGLPYAERQQRIQALNDEVNALREQQCIMDAQLYEHGSDADRQYARPEIVLGLIGV